MKNVMINDTLKSYCQDIDNLILHPEQAIYFIPPQPKVGDQMIFAYRVENILSRPITPIVIQITHVRYDVQEETWVWFATCVWMRDFSPRDKAVAVSVLAGGEEGELKGIWRDGMMATRENKFYDYREWVMSSLLPQNHEDTSGVSEKTLQLLRVKNEEVNINLTANDEPPLLTLGCTMKDLFLWSLPRSAKIPLLGKYIRANARKRKMFLNQRGRLEDELRRLRRVGKVTGATPLWKSNVDKLILQMGVFCQTWADKTHWQLIALQILRHKDSLSLVPETEPVDPILTPIKRWLNEFVFPV